MASFKFIIGKILEHPILPECVEYRVEKFPGNIDNSLAGAAPRFNTFVEVTHVGAVFYVDERKLYPPGAGSFIATLGDAADELCIVGLADARRSVNVVGALIYMNNKTP